MVPVGMLNQLRRDLVQALVHKLGERLPRTIDRSAGQRMLGEISEEFKVTDAAHQETPQLSVLCRTLDQLRSVAETEVDLLYVDFHDVREYRQAVQIAHTVNKKIGVASVRMQKPSEMGVLRAMMKHEPDYVLARNLAAIEYAKNLGVGIISDFSLNVANHRSAQWIRSLGAQRVTISYDLNREQVSALCQSMPTSWMEIVFASAYAMFHM